MFVRLKCWELASSIGLLSCFLVPLTPLAQSKEPEQAPAQAAKSLVVESAMLKTIESTQVAAHASGIIREMAVKEGAIVKSGDEIGRIQDGGVKLQAERAKVAVEVARKKQANNIDVKLAAKNQAVAENEYQRAVAANQQLRDVYPINEIDRLKLIFDRTTLESERAAFDKSMAALEATAAEIEYKQALELCERHRIIAPCNGVVTAVERRVGEWAEPGNVLLRIVQIDRLRIEGFLTAHDATDDLLGKHAEVVIENSKSKLPLKAELVFISPDANPVNGQVRVFLEIDNTDGKLRPGMRPKVQLRPAP